MSDNPSLANTSPFPNFLFDQVMPFLVCSEWMVLSHAVRQIMGYSDKRADRQAPISLSNFEHTGLGRAAIVKALDVLQSVGLLTKIGKHTRDGQVWELATEDKIDAEKLRAHAEQRKQKGKAKIANARSVQQTGELDRPVSTTDQQRSVQQTGSGLLDRHNKEKIQRKDQRSARTKKVPKERERDLLFDAIAEYLFDAPPGDERVKAVGGRVGPVKEWLLDFDPKLSPERIKRFAAWYKAKNPNADLPRVKDKVLDHYSAWKKAVAGSLNGSPGSDLPPGKVLTPDGRIVSPGQLRMEQIIAAEKAASTQKAVVNG